MMNHRVLIIDDNLDFCEILNDFFEIHDDIDVTGIANNGEDGFELILKTRPDIVLLDMVMPHRDGIYVLERMNAELKKRPMVIILSALGRDKITETAIALGADYYIIKPVNLDALADRIRSSS